jgi:phospholipid transport system substrate-binding protein
MAWSYAAPGWRLLPDVGNHGTESPRKTRFGGRFMQSQRSPIAAIIIGIVAVLAAMPGALRAGEPLNALKAVTDRVLEVLRDPNLQSKAKKRERIERLEQIINPIFDYEETAKRALGPHWRRLTPTEQREFVKLFRAFLKKVYSDRIDEYVGQKIVFGRESIEGDYAEINATVVSAKGEESSVIFKLRRTEGKWLVYDAVVENISIVNNYRSQFDRVIRTSSYEDLVKKIRDMVKS